ncbi:MAG TPA: hypothetical protein VF165_07105 [Nocardioidaceae bacterium]
MRSVTIALTAVLLSVTAGCTGEKDRGQQPEPAAATDLPRGGQRVELNPDDFTTHITNRYWPMKPGTRWTYRETDEEGNVQDVVVVVTRQTRRIANGVTARVVRDTVSAKGEVVEDTRDWYAQDRAGNIWYLGEDTAEFEDGKVASREGSFEAGADGAQAGIIVPAHPRPGLSYRQEYLQGEAEDNGEVLSLDEMAQVPLGRYKDALLTKDTSGTEPNVVEYKLYAPGTGPVLTLGVSGGAGREELVRMDQAPSSAGTGPLGSPNP